jgi:hypothetical protein
MGIFAWMQLKKHYLKGQWCKNDMMLSKQETTKSRDNDDFLCLV